MGIIISHYRDEWWFNLSTEPGPCDVSHFVLNLDQGFVVMLNVDPLAMTSVTLVPHRDKKRETLSCSSCCGSTVMYFPGRQRSPVLIWMKLSLNWHVKAVVFKVESHSMVVFVTQVLCQVPSKVKISSGFGGVNKCEIGQNKLQGFS